MIGPFEALDRRDAARLADEEERERQARIEAEADVQARKERLQLMTPAQLFDAATDAMARAERIASTWNGDTSQYYARVAAFGALAQTKMLLGMAQDSVVPPSMSRAEAQTVDHTVPADS